MPVTMVEIDVARAAADFAIEARRLCPFDEDGCDACHELVAHHESNVLGLLRQWWDQGCREVPLGPVLPAQLSPEDRDEMRVALVAAVGLFDRVQIDPTHLLALLDDADAANEARAEISKLEEALAVIKDNEERDRVEAGGGS